MNIDFNKNNGLVPAIIQNSDNQLVLMMAYMNKEAYEKTIETQLVTFFSRSKNRLWTKGESSGNYLHLVSIAVDCDQDTLLIQARPDGPSCHTGANTCWGAQKENKLRFIDTLEETIKIRKNKPTAQSYTSDLFAKGTHKIAQKLGEEAVETVIEALRTEDDLFLEESADLFFHYLVLLQAKNFTLVDVLKVLEKRH